MEPERSLRTASGSSPTTPPARIDKLTLPPEIFFHSAPMFSITLYHCESVGASVAMMISTFWARAAPARTDNTAQSMIVFRISSPYCCCLLYTSDAADEEDSVDHRGRRI